MSDYLNQIETAEEEVKTAKKNLAAAEKRKKSELRTLNKELQRAADRLNRPQSRYNGVEVYLNHVEYEGRSYTIDKNTLVTVETSSGSIWKKDPEEVYITVDTVDGSFVCTCKKEKEGDARKFAASLMTAAMNAGSQYEQARKEFQDARQAVQMREEDRAEIEDCEAILADKQDALQYLIDIGSPEEKAALFERNQKKKKNNIFLGILAVVMVIGFLVAMASMPQSSGTQSAAKTSETESRETAKETNAKTQEKKQEEIKEEQKEEVQAEEEMQTEEETQAEEEVQEETPAAGIPEDGIRPEFREAMESYEAFFDSYIDFMESIDETSLATEEMLKYYQFLQQYEETMNKLDAIDESELTPQEDLLYLETMNRINSKLYNSIQ